MRWTALLIFVLALPGAARAEPLPRIQRSVAERATEWGNVWAGYSVEGQKPEWFTMNGTGGSAPERETRLAIGSNTKSFTALLVAKAVEGFRPGDKPLLPRGYETTMEELAPLLGLDAAKDVNPKLRKVSIANLLTHTGGMPGEGFVRKSTTREALVRELLAREPAKARPGDKPHAPGELFSFRYSDDGYDLLGAIVEKLAKRPWREMIQTEIYDKLEMRRGCDFTSNFKHPKTQVVALPPISAENAGACAQAKPPTIASTAAAVQGISTLSIGDSFDPEVNDPAAAVYCPMEDWLKYLRFQSEAASATPGHLPATGILHKPESYALLAKRVPGWLGDRTLGGWQNETTEHDGEYVFHYGSNGGYLSVSMTDVQPGPGGKRASVAVLTDYPWDESKDTFGELKRLAQSMRKDLNRPEAN
jgi:CubicO group peptidase (beta-lactamase class C family)